MTTYNDVMRNGVDQKHNNFKIQYSNPKYNNSIENRHLSKLNHESKSKRRELTIYVEKS